MDNNVKSQIHEYWNGNQHDSATMGISGIGTGLPIEIPYRIKEEQKVLEKYLPSAPFSMLELGCGAGRWGIGLVNSLSHYEGVDLSKQQIEIACDTASRRHYNNLHFTCGDVRNYVPLRNSYDVIYFSGVTPFFDDDDLAHLIGRYLPYLKLGGIIVERTTTFVGDKRYVRDESGYWCTYRLNREVIRAFVKQGLDYVADERSYTFLRIPELWDSPELGFLASWGLNNMPTAMCAIMEAFSASVNRREDPFCHEGDKVYDHRFFIFSADNTENKLS